jgi:hypothetical protein
MPRWRPLGCSKSVLFAQDGDCALKVVGRCLIPDLPGVTGEESANAPHALSLDHIKEQAHFGADHRPENLLSVHRYCNQVRGKRPFVQFVGRNNARRIADLFPRVAPTIHECLGSM